MRPYMIIWFVDPPRQSNFGGVAGLGAAGSPIGLMDLGGLGPLAPQTGMSGPDPWLQPRFDALFPGRRSEGQGNQR